MDLQRRVNAHANCLTSMGYEVVSVALYGSQNYHLADAASDVDTKAMVMPTPENLYFGEHVKPKVIEQLGGQTDVKDFRHMFDNFLKSNVNFLETLYTPYQYTGKWFYFLMSELREHRDLVANYSPRSVMNACAGMVHQKFSRLFKSYPSSRALDLAKGFNMKELCHMMRLSYFMMDYAKGYPFAECLVPKGSYLTVLQEIRADKFSCELAEAQAYNALKSVELMKEQCPVMKREDNPRAAEFLRELTRLSMHWHMKRVLEEATPPEYKEDDYEDADND